jgi:hypothetical protein
LTHRVAAVLLERDCEAVGGIDLSPVDRSEKDPHHALPRPSRHAVVVIGRAQQDQRVDDDLVDRRLVVGHDGLVGVGGGGVR